MLLLAWCEYNVKCPQSKILSMTIDRVSVRLVLYFTDISRKALIVLADGIEKRKFHMLENNIDLIENIQHYYTKRIIYCVCRTLIMKLN